MAKLKDRSTTTSFYLPMSKLDRIDEIVEEDGFKSRNELILFWLEKHEKEKKNK